jgi:signal transduction histidine kinase/ActR/RegA family two-component response regulator
MRLERLESSMRLAQVRIETERPPDSGRVSRPLTLEDDLLAPTAEVMAEIVAQTPDYVFVVNHEGIIELVNRVDAPSSPDDVLGSGIWQHIDVRQDEAERMILRVLSGRAVEERTFSAPGLRGERFFNARMRALDTPSGPRAVIFLSDVTERHLAQQELARTVRQLEESRRATDHAQRFESLGRLAGGVAHDFNNLLTSIISFSRFVMDDLAPGDPRRADLTEVLRAADNATKLTSQLLAFSRKRPIEPRCIDLHAAMTSLGQLLHRVVGERIRVVIDTSQPGVNVMVDPGQLDQLLMNLSVNAKDAMPDGGTLTLALRRETVLRHDVLAPGEYAALSVRDSGVGMTEAVRRQVFEPFFTTKGEHGTGLGLSTCYGIISQAKGHVDVQSEPGRGACFTVYLPLAPAASKPVDGAAASPRPAAVQGLALVVEDQPAIKRTMARSLKELGLKVLEAGSAEEALALVEQLDAQIDLLVTDVVLPGITGMKLAEQLRRRHPKLRVVVSSGYLGAESENPSMQAPNTMFVAKPFTGRQLMSAVSSLYGQDLTAKTPAAA